MPDTQFSYPPSTAKPSNANPTYIAPVNVTVAPTTASQTTGIGVPVRLRLDATNVQLILPSAETEIVPLSAEFASLPTQHQIVVSVVDALGNVLTSQQAPTFSSRNPQIATVSPTGLVTAVSSGSTVAQISLPYANNEITADLYVRVIPNSPQSYQAFIDAVDSATNERSQGPIFIGLPEAPEAPVPGSFVPEGH